MKILKNLSSKSGLALRVNFFSRWQIEVFLFFPENRLWHFMQIVINEDSKLHEMSNPAFYEK